MKRFLAALLILAWPAAAQQVAVYNDTGSNPSGAPQVRVSVGDLTLGTAGSVLGKLVLCGNTSGCVTVRTAAAAGTFDFWLPAAAGTAGQPMLSGGGAASNTYGTLSQAGGGTGSTCGAGCLGSTTVDMAITTDQSIALNLGVATRWMPGVNVTAAGSTAFVLHTCSAANQSASTGALYRAASKTNAITAVTTMANLVGNIQNIQRVPPTATAASYTETTVYFAMTSAGSAGTCVVNVMGATL